MNRVVFAMLVSIFAVTSTNAQIRWQTTRDGNSSGNCRIQTNKFTIIVHPLHVDIEEEAEITTLNTVPWGDARTLEIINEFTLAPNTAIRSMLLWNGDILLKAIKAVF